MTADARQRAREAFEAVFSWSAMTSAHNPVDARRMLIDGVEAYFDERMRGDARDPGDGPGAWARGWDAGHASAAEHVDRLRTRVAELEAQLAHDRSESERRVQIAEAWAAKCRKGTAELEAVVRAADAMRAKAHCRMAPDYGDYTSGPCGCAVCVRNKAYDAARAKVQVPGE